MKRPIREQIRDLEKQVPAFVSMMGGLARQNEIYIVAGTIPVADEQSGRVYNHCGPAA